MTEIMPVPRNLILLSYQQRALWIFLFDRKRSKTERAAAAARSVHLVGFVEQRAQCAAGIEAGVAGVGEVDNLRGGIGKNVG